MLAAGLPAILWAAEPSANKWNWTLPEITQIKANELRVRKEESFFVLASEHWVVKTEISARFTSELATFLELFWNNFQAIMCFNAAPQVKLKPTVVVFAKIDDYKIIYDDGTRGHCKYQWDTQGNWKYFHLYSFVKNDKERDFTLFYHPILLHEGTHILLRQYLGKSHLPIFIDEGLASFFQAWDLRSSMFGEENLKKRYARSFYPPYLKEFADGAKEIPKIADLCEISDKNWNPDKMGPIALRNYALAECFIDLLVVNPQCQPFLRRMVQNLLKPEYSANPLDEDSIKLLEPVWADRVREIAKKSHALNPKI